MLKNIRGLLHAPVTASDGEVGTVTGFVLDKDLWELSCLEVKTGLWNIFRTLRLPPQFLLTTRDGTLRSPLTRDSTVAACSIDVSAQTPHPLPHLGIELPQGRSMTRGDLLKAVPSGTSVIGLIRDFIVDTPRWKIHFAIADVVTRNGHRKIVIPPHWIDCRFSYDRKLPLTFQKDRTPPALLPEVSLSY